jgi:hypothetical protein
MIRPAARGVQRIEGEEKDCTVRALANVLSAPYPLIHKVLAKAGRKPRRGVVFDHWHPVYTRLGLRLLSVHGRSRASKYIAGKVQGVDVSDGCTLGRLLPTLQQGRYVVKIQQHVFAVVDGKVLDYSAMSDGCRVHAVYKLEQQAVIFDQ